MSDDLTRLTNTEMFFIRSASTAWFGINESSPGGYINNKKYEIG
jgi:hypothetical protein